MQTWNHDSEKASIWPEDEQCKKVWKEKDVMGEASVGSLYYLKQLKYLSGRPYDPCSADIVASHA
jgi:hypothetical protein